MAINIKIEKIKDIDNIHYYLVETKNFDSPPSFIIGIDDAKHRIYFYKNEIKEHSDYEVDLDNLAKRIDFYKSRIKEGNGYEVDENNPDDNPNCDWIDRGLATRVISKAYYAFKNKKYPEFISYQA